MLAGQRHPKLLAPRGRSLTWLENKVLVHSVRSGLEQAENDLAEPAARFAERNVSVITAGRPNAGATGHRVKPSIPEKTRAAPLQPPTRSAPRTPAAKSRTSVRARERCTPGRDVADRRLPPEAEWASFTRMENEE
ncbi:hypothetical protein ACVIHH_003958 [Bradyrhizobium sp. USDA 4518]